MKAVYRWEISSHVIDFFLQIRHIYLNKTEDRHTANTEITTMITYNVQCGQNVAALTQ